MTKEIIWEHDLPREHTVFEMVEFEPIVSGWHDKKSATYEALYPNKFKTKTYKSLYHRPGIPLEPKGKGWEKYLQGLAKYYVDQGYDIAPVRPTYKNGAVRFFARSPEEVLQEKMGDLCE